MFFDRPEAGHKAVLMHVRFNAEPISDEVQEFRELTSSADLDALEIVIANRAQPHPKYFVGRGKAEEIAAVIENTGAELLLVNHELSPGQQRNLETLVQARVMTRTELILHIFADRARTHEGQLQVELAQLQHAQTRVVRGWTHLDRQRGGTGGTNMRGAGETQLELDQRMLHERIKRVKQRLQRVERQRSQSRRQRARARVPTIALVGYTNAGKSTLFNALTQATVLAEDRLFATLDPTMRKLELDGFGEVVLADTVGFIRALPTSLVEAFKATLEEVAEADLLLHVVDAAAPDVVSNIDAVTNVLLEIGALGVPTIDVYNKADCLARPVGREDSKVFVSALEGTGLEDLKSTIAEHLGVAIAPVEVHVAAACGQTRAWLYDMGAVLDETQQEDGSSAFSLRMDDDRLARLLSMDGVTLQGEPSVHRISLLP